MKIIEKLEALIVEAVQTDLDGEEFQQWKAGWDRSGTRLQSAPK
jgi:hypothetical protein